MHILLFPVGFILWYLAYEAKPIINDEVKLIWEEKNTINRYKLLNIINESFYNLLLIDFDHSLCLLSRSEINCF